MHVSASSSKRYRVKTAGVIRGPFTPGRIQQLLDDGTIGPGDGACAEGEDWITVAAVLGLPVVVHTARPASSATGVPPRRTWPSTVARVSMFATRSMSLEGRQQIPGSRAQDLDLSGDVIYAALRGRATWQQFALDVDIALAPEEFVLGGDLEDFSQDIEARVSYSLPQRDISFFAGVRYSEFAASGVANGFRYDTDLVVDGFQLGVLVTF